MQEFFEVIHHIFRNGGSTTFVARVYQFLDRVS